MYAALESPTVPVCRVYCSAREFPFPILFVFLLFTPRSLNRCITYALLVCVFVVPLLLPHSPKHALALFLFLFLSFSLSLSFFFLFLNNNFLIYK